MQPKKSIENQYQEMAQMMACTANRKLDQLNKVEQAVILAHTLNLEFGLQCVNRNLEAVEFPDNWIDAQEGVYRFNYYLKEGINQKLVQFRFVNNHQDDGSISINYSLEDSEDLHQFQLKYDFQGNEQKAKKYQEHLQSKLKPNKNKQEQQKPIILQPQFRISPAFQEPRNPFPIIVPHQSNNPFRLPNSGSEYIGPDNEIFRGRGENGVFGPFNSDPYSIPNPRRPPGARFDPLDPFGSQGLDERPRDFSGFNEFGQPFGGRGGFNPGRFM